MGVRSSPDRRIRAARSPGSNGPVIPSERIPRVRHLGERDPTLDPDQVLPLDEPAGRLGWRVLFLKGRPRGISVDRGAVPVTPSNGQESGSVLAGVAQAAFSSRLPERRRALPMRERSWREMRAAQTKWRAR